eukprot:COSAG01_NODE_17836_length_1119_cov_1.863859_1_plen_75_part_10
MLLPCLPGGCWLQPAAAAASQPPKTESKSMTVRTVNAFLHIIYIMNFCAYHEFLPTVGLAMVVNLRRGYPDTVLA